MRLDNHEVVASTPVPTATGPVTRRTLRAQRRASCPRPRGTSGSSTTRSRGSSGSSTSWPASRSASGGDGRRAQGGARRAAARSVPLPGTTCCTSRCGGERHDQRGDAHGEARGGVVLRVVRRRRPGLPRRGASGSGAPPPSTRSRRGWRRRWGRRPPAQPTRHPARRPAVACADGRRTERDAVPRRARPPGRVRARSTRWSPASPTTTGGCAASGSRRRSSSSTSPSRAPTGATTS